MDIDMEMRKIKEIGPSKSSAMFTTKRACAYVRVSTDSEKQLLSLQNQTEYYEQLIKEHPEYTFYGIYSDAGVSGAKANRPGFTAMLETARNGEVDVIFTKSISRFARNTLLMLESVRELRSLGVGVIFEEQGIDTLTADGDFMLTILASIAEEERRSVCENVRIALRNRAKLGSANVQIERLLGYHRDEKGNIAVNEKEAKIIRKIYRLYISGMTQEQIAEYLNRNKYPPYATPGVPWDYHQVGRVLYNEKYAGDCVRLKYYNTDDGKSHVNRGELPMVYIRDNHAPIISRRDWEKAQARLAEHRKPVRPYTGMLKCPHCGASLHRHSRNYSADVDWVCATLLVKGKAACAGVRIPEEALEGLAAGMLPLAEPLIVLENYDDKKSRRRKTEKDFRLIPLSKHRRGSGKG
jgi:site-specific DNA recombinase